MKTYRIIARSHDSAQISVVAIVKRGDPVAKVDAQLRSAGFDPDQFGPVTAYDTKTEDHRIAHEIYAKVRSRMKTWTRGRNRLKQPLTRQGDGPQTIFPVSGSELSSMIHAVLHATTNRDSGGTRIGRDDRAHYRFGGRYNHMYGYR